MQIFISNASATYIHTSAGKSVLFSFAWKRGLMDRWDIPVRFFQILIRHNIVLTTDHFSLSKCVTHHVFFFFVFLCNTHDKKHYGMSYFFFFISCSNHTVQNAFSDSLVQAVATAKVRENMWNQKALMLTDQEQRGTIWAAVQSSHSQNAFTKPFWWHSLFLQAWQKQFSQLTMENEKCLIAFFAFAIVNSQEVLSNNQRLNSSCLWNTYTLHTMKNPPEPISCSKKKISHWFRTFFYPYSKMLAVLQR